MPTSTFDEYSKLQEPEEDEGPRTQPRNRMEDCCQTEISRTEEPWNDEMEILINSWRNSSQELSVAHNNSGIACKKKHVLYGLPSLMIPMLMTPLSAALKDYDFISYLEMSAFMCTAITTAMVQFFNFSGKREKHFAFSARYADLVTDIDQELAKAKSFRQPVDTFSLKVKMMYDALNRAAPDL